MIQANEVDVAKSMKPEMDRKPVSRTTLLLAVLLMVVCFQPGTMSWAQTGAEQDLSLPSGPVGMAEAAFSQGVTLSADGRFDEALQLFNLAIETRPGVALYHEVRGDAYFSLGNADYFFLAKADYQAALRLEPDRKRAWEGMAQVSLAMGFMGEALDAYEKLTFGFGDLDPKYLTDLVAFYVVADEVTRGITALSPYTHSPESPPQILLQLATLYRYQENYDAALGLTSRVQRNPDVSEDLRTMASELQAQWYADQQAAVDESQ